MPVKTVGRDDEIAALHAFFDRAGDGPGAVVLEGEPGIGKTTLWLAGIEAARERSMRVLSARPAQAEDGLAYAILGDLLEPCIDEVVTALPAPRRRALEGALSLGGDDGPPADRHALAAGVRSALSALSDHGPLVVAIDDVQWADASSSAALAFALRRLDRAPVSVLLARRGTGEPSTLESALEDGGLQRIHVGPLSLGALQGLVRERLGRTFPRPTTLRLHEVSGGNPFFALELARALDLAARPLDPAAPLPVPATLEHLVGARLRILPVETRAALLVVAVVGAPTIALLDAVGVTTETLEPAAAGQVLELADGGARFTHPLLASGAIALATEDERRHAHRVVAAVVDEPLARARHLAAALVGADEAVADELEQAAGIARFRGAASLAAELGEAAVRATPGDRPADLRRLRRQAARDHAAAGAPERALVLARRELDEAVPGLRRGEALALLGELEALADDLRAACAHLREALGESDGAPELQVAVHDQLAGSLRITETLDLAEQHGREAVRLAEQLGDPVQTARSLATLAVILYNRGEPEAFSLAERAVELGAESCDERARFEAAHALSHCLVWSGRIDEARPLLVDLLERVADRDEHAAMDVLWFLALVEERAGRLSLARAHAERAFDVALQYLAGEPEHDPGVLLPIVRVAARRGELRRARELAERAVARSEAVGGSSTGRAQLALLGVLDHWDGDHSRAVERFEAFERDRLAAGASNSTSVHLLDHAEALLSLGRDGDAVLLLDDWERQARRLGNVEAMAQIVCGRGLAAAASGEIEEALRLLEDAVAEHEAARDPFGRARALLALGVTRRRARQKRASRAAIEAALATFEEVGAAWWAERARAELGAIGGRTRAEGLTPAELRVATLVAGGRTNREVAAALFLGERTVETHLSHVYAKLGIRSRTELARTLD